MGHSKGQLGTIILFVVATAILVASLNAIAKQGKESEKAAAEYIKNVGADKDDVIAVASTQAVQHAINCVSNYEVTGKAAENCNGIQEFPKGVKQTEHKVIVDCRNEVCSIKEFYLPQSDSDFRTALAGLGDPRYVLYYESLPPEEAEVWRVDSNSLTIAGIAMAGVESAMIGAVFLLPGAGKTLAKIEAKGIEALIKRGAISGSSRIGKKAINVAATQRIFKAIDKQAIDDLTPSVFSGKTFSQLNSKEQAKVNAEFAKKLKNDKAFRKEMKNRYKNAESQIKAEEGKIANGIAKIKEASKTTKEEVSRVEVMRAVKDNGPKVQEMNEIALQMIDEIGLPPTALELEKKAAANSIVASTLEGKPLTETLQEVTDDSLGAAPSLRKIGNGQGIGLEDIAIIRRVLDDSIDSIPLSEKKAMVMNKRAAESLDTLGDPIPLQQLGGTTVEAALNTPTAAREAMIDLILRPAAIADRVSARTGIDQAKSREIFDGINSKIAYGSDSIFHAEDDFILENGQKVLKEGAVPKLQTRNAYNIMDEAIDGLSPDVDKIALKKAIGAEIAAKISGKEYAKELMKRSLESFQKRYNALTPKAREALMKSVYENRLLTQSQSIRFAVFDALQETDLVPKEVTIDGKTVDTDTLFQCANIAGRLSTAGLGRVIPATGSFTEAVPRLGFTEASCIWMSLAMANLRLSDCHQQKFNSVGSNALGLSKAVEPFTTRGSGEVEEFDSNSCEDSLLRFDLEDNANYFYIDTFRATSSATSPRFYAASPCKANIEVRATKKSCVLQLCASGDPMAHEAYTKPENDLRDGNGVLINKYNKIIDANGNQLTYDLYETDVAAENDASKGRIPLREKVCGRYNVQDPSVAKHRLEVDKIANPVRYLNPLQLGGAIGIFIKSSFDSGSFGGNLDFFESRTWFSEVMKKYRQNQQNLAKMWEDLTKACKPNAEGSFFKICVPFIGCTGDLPIPTVGNVIDLPFDLVGGGTYLIGEAVRWTNIPGVRDVGWLVSTAGSGINNAGNFVGGFVCDVAGGVLSFATDKGHTLVVGSSVIVPMKTEMMLLDPYVGDIYTAHKIYNTGTEKCERCGRIAADVLAAGSSGKRTIINSPYRKDYPILPADATAIKFCEDTAFTQDVGNYFARVWTATTENPTVLLSEYGNPRIDTSAITISITPTPNSYPNFCYSDPTAGNWYKIATSGVLIATDVIVSSFTGGVATTTVTTLTGMAYVWFDDNIKQTSAWPHREVTFLDATIGDGAIRSWIDKTGWSR